MDCQYSTEEHHSTHLSMYHLKDYLDHHFYVSNPPKRIYFVGMCHKVDHDSFNELLVFLPSLFMHIDPI